MISDSLSGQHSSIPAITTEEANPPVAFGLNLTLLLLALLPLWLFLASLLPVLALIGLGLLEEEVFYLALLVASFIVHTVLLPLCAYRVHLQNERRRAIVDEKLSHFASRLVELYAATHRSSEVAADPRAAQAFKLYLLASEELRKDHLGPQQQARGMIVRGTSLAERALTAGGRKTIG